MLALRRRLGEAILIGDNVRVTVVSIDGASVRLAIEAPGIPVFREELLASLQQENQRASRTRSPMTGQGIHNGRVQIPQGLFGFGDHREFILYDVDASFRAIVSVLDPTLCFFLVDPTVVDPAFPLELAFAAYPFESEPLAVAAIVTRPADGSMPTVNLRAPLVIGVGSGRGAQIILSDDRLAIRQPLRSTDTEEGAAP